MDLKLYKHQIEFLKQNPNKALCAFEAGTGKTLTAVEWLRTRQGNAIVIVPKRISQKWKKELREVKATVLTKEEWKKTDFENPTALVIDEAHLHSSPLFLKKGRGRSKLSEKTYNFIKKYPECPVLLLTATPISSNPWNLHTLLCFIGVYIDWKKWRDEFYDLVHPGGNNYWLDKPAYLPKPNWRILIRPYLTKYSHVALMSDCVEYLPPTTEETISTPCEPFVFDTTMEVTKRFSEEYRHEQRDKVKTIREIGVGYRKIMVIAFFREQIEDLAKELSKDKKVYMLHGGIIDQEEVIKQAQDDGECYFICQSGIGVGFDADSFSVMIFASMGYSYVSFVQMKARIRRIHNLKPVKYYYIIAGRCDAGVLAQLEKGKDFDPKYFYDSPRITKTK